MEHAIEPGTPQVCASAAGHHRARPGPGEVCRHCFEGFDASGGVALGHDGDGLRFYHRECLLRITEGGVHHQMGRCRCCGGSLAPDPPGLNRREAARVAMRFFLEKRRNPAPGGAGLPG